MFESGVKGEGNVAVHENSERNNCKPPLVS